MTDEPDKAGKLIKATLVLFAMLLLALALFAGCKPPAQKASFMLADDDGVQFIEWTQEGRQIRGSINVSELKPGGEIGTSLVFFDGVLDGENVSMTLKSSWTLRGGDKALKGEITGLLRGDTLWVFPTPGSEPGQFRRATATEHAEASRKLQTRAKLNKGAH